MAAGPLTAPSGTVRRPLVRPVSHPPTSLSFPACPAAEGGPAAMATVAPGAGPYSRCAATVNGGAPQVSPKKRGRPWHPSPRPSSEPRPQSRQTGWKGPPRERLPGKRSEVTRDWEGLLGGLQRGPGPARFPEEGAGNEAASESRKSPKPAPPTLRLPPTPPCDGGLRGWTPRAERQPEPSGSRKTQARS